MSCIMKHKIIQVTGEGNNRHVGYPPPPPPIPGSSYIYNTLRLKEIVMMKKKHIPAHAGKVAIQHNYVITKLLPLSAFKSQQS